MKAVKRSFLVLLVTVLAVTLYFTYTGRTQTISEHENRTLARSPDFSAQSFWDASYFGGWDDYFSDHIMFRDNLMRTYVKLQLNFKKSVVLNNVVISDGALLPYLNITDDSAYDYEGSANEAADRVLKIQNAVESYGGRFLYVGVEEQRTALGDKYPSYVFNRSEFYRGVEESFEKACREKGVNTLFMKYELDENTPTEHYYYLTDHHYNMYGAYETYRAVLNRMKSDGLSAPAIAENEIEIYPLKNEFLGAYSRKLYGLSPVKDSFTAFNVDSKWDVEYERWDEGAKSDRKGLVLPDDDASPVSYNSYMGGDFAETVVKTHRDSLPDILIVGDSFTNPLEALCLYSFNEMRSLDFRHYNQKTLTEYLKDYPADVVLIVRDSLNYCEKNENGDLK